MSLCEIFPVTIECFSTNYGSELVFRFIIIWMNGLVNFCIKLKCESAMTYVSGVGILYLIVQRNPIFITTIYYGVWTMEILRLFIIVVLIC